ncbi:unnamed protein product [Choristocarpus tenellus]|uniref:50S ribosomal protein L29 n=1 Tax=Choristocarpus tenellus TaxID=116065 RepID=UPI002E76560C|nr:50S ribosomal protein L29 [Choristocarpus tenellus]WAM62325.1 50S ribosomal protein L29 [Choristocarpus tenellus]
MGFSKIDEIKSLTDIELENEILNIKKQLFNLRLRRGTRQSFKAHQFKHARRRLRQLLMIKKDHLEN